LIDKQEAMRAHFEGLGEVAGAIIAAEDDIIGTIRQPQEADIELGFQVQRQEEVILLGTQTHHEHILVVCRRRMSYADHDFESGETAHISDAEAAAEELLEEEGGFRGAISLEKANVNDVDFFDGVSYAEKIFPYTDSFSVKEYDEVAERVRQTSRYLMTNLQEELDIDIVTQDETAGAEQTGPTAFQ
jgi:hypothetical protein